MPDAYPFVSFDHEMTERISNPYKTILDIKAYTLTVTSIIGINLSPVDIFVSVFIATEGQENLFLRIPPTKLLKNGTIELLADSYITLYPGEYLVASSDSSSSFFNTDVNFRILSELPFEEE